MSSNARQAADEWAMKADRGAVAAYLTEAAYRLNALEGSDKFNGETEFATSQHLQDAAESLAAALESEFATRVNL